MLCSIITRYLNLFESDVKQHYKKPAIVLYKLRLFLSGSLMLSQPADEIKDLFKINLAS